MTETIKPDHRGEHEISRYNHCVRECRVFRCDRGDYTRVLPTLCTRGCGCGGHPAFPPPSVGRKIHAQLGRIAPRERGVVSHEYERATFSFVIARGKRAIQYSRDVDNGIERPRRTGYPESGV